MLQVNEIFYSLQGESTAAGRPCVFVRLSGCNLACHYCDTVYALTAAAGRTMTIAGIITEVGRFGCRLVEVTGGEPLQQESTPELLFGLVKEGYEVLLESNGSLPLPKNLGWRVIMDIKCPGSAMAEHFRVENLAVLEPGDELKFVVGNRGDFDWACELIRKLGLADHGREILFSPVLDRCSPAALAEWILAARLPARLQLQLHKLIWPGGEPGYPLRD